VTQGVRGQLWGRLGARKVIATVALAASLLGALYVSQATATKAPALTTLAIVGITVGAVVAMSRRDAVSLLTVVLVPLFLIPENYSIAGPLKSVGYPPLLAGLACLAVWAVARWTGAIRAVPWHPFRWTMLVFLLTSMMSYAAALTRNLVQAEADSATRMIFPLLAMVGIAMLATDGLSTVEQVERLLKRLVFLTTLEGLIGALEYAFHLDYRTLARLPGMVVNTEVGDSIRNGIDRIEAAAAHPIEFSLALATAVPLALHFALNAGDTRSRRLFWACFGIMAGVIPLTVSRTGLLGVAICIIVYGSVLRGRARANLLVLSTIGLVTFPILAPRVLGTIKNFVFAGTTDNSITGRLDDYALIPLLMDGHWWFGRGFGTFQPLVYFFLDNQYLMQLLTGGIVSLLAFLGIFVVGAGVARGARKRFTRTRDRDLAQAIAAPILAIAVGAGTFDLFSFLQCAFTLFLLCGCAAALWTISRREARAAEADAPEALLASAGDTAAAEGRSSEPVGAMG
jgi:hypothetical protein